MSQVSRLAMDLALNPQSDLEWYNASSLKTMLRWRTDRWRDFKSKTDVLTMLAQCLLDPASIRLAHDSTDPLAREALALLKHKGGAMPLAAMTGQIAVWHADLDAARLRAVPCELVRRALAFWHTPASSYSRTVHDIQRPAAENVHSVVIFSAPEILDQVVVPASLGVTALEAVGKAEIHETPSSWQRRALGFLRAIETRSPKILQSGGIGSRDRDALTQAVGLDGEVPGAPRLSPASFFRAIMGAAGLLEVTGERQLRTTPAALSFVSLSPSRQTQALLNAWLDSGENELLALGHLRCERHAHVPRVTPDNEQVKRAHRCLVDLLREKVRPGRWYRLADVSRVVRYQDVEFLVSWLDRSPYRWSSYDYFYDRERVRFPPYPGVTLEDSRGRSRSLVMGADWELVEGAFIRAVFHGPLTWLGLVECEVRPDGQDVFALTPLGAQALEIVGGSLPPNLQDIPSYRDALVVQPNFDVVIYSPDERPDLLYHVDRFAERVSVDRLAIYNLTNEAVSAGLQLGLRINDVIDLLSSAARTPLPQNVTFTLRDWARRFEEVHWYRNAWLIEAPDEATLDRWMSDPTIARLAERRLSPTVLLCAGERPAALPRVLASLGANVRTVDADAPLTPAGDAARVTGLSIPSGDAHLYLRHALDAIADHISDDDGEDGHGCRYQITRQSIERAAQAGMNPDQVLDVVGKVLRGAVPAGMRVRIIGWAGGYGPVSLGQVGILVAPSHDALRDLRSDPAFARSFVLTISPTAAIVDLSALESLRQALAERGIVTRPYDAETVRLI